MFNSTNNVGFLLFFWPDDFIDSAIVLSVIERVSI